MRTHVLVIHETHDDGRVVTRQDKATGKCSNVELTRLPRWMRDGSNAPKNRGKKGKRKGKRFGSN